MNQNELKKKQNTINFIFFFVYFQFCSSCQVFPFHFGSFRFFAADFGFSRYILGFCNLFQIFPFYFGPIWFLFVQFRFSHFNLVHLGFSEFILALRCSFSFLVFHLFLFFSFLFLSSFECEVKFRCPTFLLMIALIQWLFHNQYCYLLVDFHWLPASCWTIPILCKF